MTDEDIEMIVCDVYTDANNGVNLREESKVLLALWEKLLKAESEVKRLKERRFKWESFEDWCDQNHSYLVRGGWMGIVKAAWNAAREEI